MRKASVAPIPLISVLDAEDDAIAAFGAGANDYLTNPLGS